MTAEINNTPIFRFDSIKLESKTDGKPKVKRTKDKYFHGEAAVTRPGVFLYRNADGSIRRELRHPDDVFASESLSSLVGLPITLDHPPEFVDASNVHKYDKGGTGDNYRIHDNLVIATLTIRPLEAINAVLDGCHELSAAYISEMIFKKGMYEGEEYDCRQINIRYNHIAIVEQGRAGSEVRLRYDSAAELIEKQTANNDKIVSNINAKNNNLKQEETIAMKEEAKMTDENMRFKIDFLNEELKTSKSENIALKQKLDSAEKELLQEKELKADTIISKQVMDRAEILIGASPYLGDITGYSRKPDRDVMIEAMNVNRTDAADFEGRSDEFVRGAFSSFLNNNRSSGNDNMLNIVKKRCDSNISKSMDEQIIQQLKR